MNRDVVHGNDWRSLDPGRIGQWTPTRRVTVVVPCYNGQEPLALTFAALANQTYPRNLLEVVVADDGSDPPITVPPGTPFEARVVAQERAGFGLARARNTGAADATGSILVFLDCDMVPEPHHVEAHARWHHLDDRLLTLGFRNHVDFSGITADDVAAAGSIDDLMGGRKVSSPQWIEFHMTRTRDLKSADTDLFRIVTGGNLGISRDFYDYLGGSDESFTQWGAEDTELGYRAFNAGGVLVPERRALAWHQGEGASGPDPDEQRSQVEQRHKLSHLIAEKGFRRSVAGRTFTVPLVTAAVDAAGCSYDDVLERVENLLASGYHDLAVGISVPDDHLEAVRIRREFGSDPRVVLTDDLLTDVPHAAVRLDVPPRVRLWPTDLASMLRGLEGFGLVCGEVELPRETEDPDRPAGPDNQVVDRSNLEVRMVRTRALRRAMHAGADDPWAAAGELFGSRTMGTEALGLKAMKLSKRPRAESTGKASVRKASGGQARVQLASVREVSAFKPVDNPPVVVLAGKVFRKLGSIRSLQDVSAVARWVVRGLRNVARRGRLKLKRRLRQQREARRAAHTQQTAMDVPEWIRLVGGAGHLPGAAQLKGKPDGVEVILVAPDASTNVTDRLGLPVVRLGAESGIPEAAPVNPRRFNPAGFLPVGASAEVEPLPDLPWPEDRVRAARGALASRMDSVHDLNSAATLLELTASGAVVIVDDPAGSEHWLGERLAALVGGVDTERLKDYTYRESVSVAQRRATHADHALPARLRQVRRAAGLPVQRPPSVSVVAATNRPEMLDRMVANVALQDHPNLELVLALHGDGFPAADPVAPDGLTLTVLRFAADTVFGHVLSAASAAASGEWVAKMDDDDWYGAEHISDLVLAAGYSGADLVGKGSEFVYLEGAGTTIRRGLGAGETPSRTLSGGTLLVRSSVLREIDGWRGLPRGVDVALIDDVASAGGALWRTHPFGYLLCRTTGRHTWSVDDHYFERQAEQTWDGLALDVAGVCEVSEPPSG
ncbi:MAG: glycosyltransferase [Acidimicrobiales bacterium]|nr:glycosyltransferase [Acidimicrobiales bacterium]